METSRPHNAGGGRSLHIAGSLEKRSPRKRRRIASNNHWIKDYATPRSLKQLGVVEIGDKIVMIINDHFYEHIETTACVFANVLVILIFACKQSFAVAICFLIRS